MERGTPLPPFESKQDVMATLGLVMDAAEPFMQPSLSYHNFGHVRYSFDFAMARCDQYDAGGRVQVDRMMVGCAIAFHDAGIAHELSEEFDSKESYSAHIAEKVLGTFGFDESFIGGVKKCILATKLDGEPETDEEKLTCLADVANVFGPYPGFLANSFHYYEELRQLHGEPRSLRDYRRSTKRLLGIYLSKDLVIDEEIDRDILGRPVYALDGFANIERFMRASSDQLTQTLGKSAVRFAKLIPEPLRRGKL